MNLKAWGLSGVGLGLLFLFSVWLFFSNRARAPLRDLISPPKRKVLSIATGKIFPEGEGRVVKLSTPEGLVLEFYSLVKPDEQPLVDRLILPDKRDAQFQFRARATNLALKDMDGDELFEVIAPSYDSTLIPHLNIFRFNKETRRFEPYEE